jgi:hypothetical protein
VLGPFVPPHSRTTLPLESVIHANATVSPDHEHWCPVSPLTLMHVPALSAVASVW